MSEYRKRQLAVDLGRLGITDSPELYTARAIAKTVLFIAAGLIFIPAGFPLLAVLSAIAGILIYIKDRQDFTKKLHRLNRQIESELPRLVETLNYSLPANRDIILFFEKYRHVAGKAMERELNRLLLDMKTGNPEAALREWDARLGIPSLSAFVGILCSSYQGIDQRTNLLVLEQDIRARERENLRREVQKRPGQGESGCAHPNPADDHHVHGAPWDDDIQEHPVPGVVNHEDEVQRPYPRRRKGKCPSIPPTSGIFCCPKIMN